MPLFRHSPVGCCYSSRSAQVADLEFSRQREDAASSPSTGRTRNVGPYPSEYYTGGDRSTPGCSRVHRPCVGVVEVRAGSEIGRPASGNSACERIALRPAPRRPTPEPAPPSGLRSTTRSGSASRSATMQRRLRLRTATDVEDFHRPSFVHTDVASEFADCFAATRDGDGVSPHRAGPNSPSAPVVERPLYLHRPVHCPRTSSTPDELTLRRARPARHKWRRHEDDLRLLSAAERSCSTAVPVGRWRVHDADDRGMPVGPALRYRWARCVSFPGAVPQHLVASAICPGSGSLTGESRNLRLARRLTSYRAPLSRSSCLAFWLIMNDRRLQPASSERKRFVAVNDGSHADDRSDRV